MKSTQKNIDQAQKLMLLQGISLIQDGLQFINWAAMPNELSHDFLLILRDRFQLFREAVLDGSTDHLMIDKLKDRMENITYGYEHNLEIQKQLQELREMVIGKQHQNKAEKE